VTGQEQPGDVGRRRSRHQQHPLARLRRHPPADRHPPDAADLATAIGRVADHRAVDLVPLARALDGFGDIGQRKWDAWRRKQHPDRLPTNFGQVVATTTGFADPLLRVTSPPASGTLHVGAGHDEVAARRVHRVVPPPH
jgi:hypothetical protein